MIVFVELSAAAACRGMLEERTARGRRMLRSRVWSVLVILVPEVGGVCFRNVIVGSTLVQFFQGY